MDEAPSAPPPAIASWSGGKDCGLALYEAQAQGLARVESLVVTCTRGYDRVSMHGVREALVEAQAERLGLPLERVVIGQGADNAEYEAATLAAYAAARGRGVTQALFGDLFLADIRAYRDRLVARAGLGALYPLWGRDTGELARRFIGLGFRAVLVCVDPRRLDPAFAGRDFDAALLADLPHGVDPCGENGEFHTFVWHGPNFAGPVDFTRGDLVERGGFAFRDLVPGH